MLNMPARESPPFEMPIAGHRMNAAARRCVHRRCPEVKQKGNIPILKEERRKTRQDSASPHPHMSNACRQRTRVVLPSTADELSSK